MSHFNEAANQWDTPEKIERTRIFAKAIQARIRFDRPVRLIDFGCGTGLLSLHFLAGSEEILGIDTSEGMLEVFGSKTKALPQVHLLNLDLESSDLRTEKKYDLVISSMAFHHLADPSVVLQKFKAVLAPKGKIAIIDLDQEDGSFHSDPAKMGVKHFGFSDAQVADWAAKAGLKRLSRDMIFSIEKNSRAYPLFLAIFAAE